MKYTMKLKIPIYEWDLAIYRLHPSGKSHKVPKQLMNDLNDENLELLQSAIDSGGIFGFCFWNEFHRMLAIVVCTDNFDDEEYIDKFTHEVNHAIDKIMKVAIIDDTESRSYLTGWMYKQFRKNGFI